MQLNRPSYAPKVKSESDRFYSGLVEIKKGQVSLPDPRFTRGITLTSAEILLDVDTLAWDVLTPINAIVNIGDEDDTKICIVGKGEFQIVKRTFGVGVREKQNGYYGPFVLVPLGREFILGTEVSDRMKLLHQIVKMGFECQSRYDLLEHHNVSAGQVKHQFPLPAITDTADLGQLRTKLEAYQERIHKLDILISKVNSGEVQADVIDDEVEGDESCI